MAKTESPEKEFRLLFELAPEGIFIADTSGRYTEVNNAGCRLLGRTREDIVGKTIVDLIPEEEVPRLWEEQKVMQKGGQIVTSEWRLRRGDGSFVPVEVSAAILKDGRWLGYVRDITSRIQSETKLQQALERATAEHLRLNTVIEQLPEGVIIIDGSGKVLTINDAAMRFAQKNNEAGTDMYGNQVIFDMRRSTGETMPLEEIPLVRALNEKKLISNYELNLFCDGRLVPVLANAAPISGETGGVIGAVAIFNDMSEFKEMERLRQDWVTVVAHDLRQPVQQIMLSAELLKTEVKASAAALRHLSEIESGLLGLSRLSQDLFDAAKMASQQFSIERRMIDLKMLVEKKVKLTELSSDRTFKVKVHAGSYTMSADEQRIEQVLDNLLTNAVKYSKKDSEIEVELQRDKNEFICSVSNYGGGLKPAEIDRLFSRFYRVPGSERVAKGSGLGLYIAKGLVEAHGGRIWAKSVPGEKTVFTFSLPTS